MTRLRTRLLGLAATLGLLAFVVGAPLLLVAINATPTLREFSWSRLTSRDDGTTALAVITVVAWIAWAIFAVSIALDIAARIRGVRAPQVPGLAVPQMGAHQLVAAAALLFVAAPTITTLLPQPRTEAAMAAPSPAPAPASNTVPSAPATAPERVERPSTPLPEKRTEAYVVHRGDSLWKIAEQRLGDGTRYVELIGLNRHILGDEPDFLLPGTTLRVPLTENPTDAETYVVQSGDTLSKIAEDHLGDPGDYPEIYRASRTEIQPDGGHLTDPDLIRPGWTLTIPGPPTAPPVNDVTPARPPTQVPPPAEPPPPASTDAPAPPPTEVTDHADHDVAPGWLLPGLAGAGAVFGAALWLVLCAQRRTQLRYRRPGRIIAAPPPELLPAEKTAFVTASVIAPRIEDLDAALKSLDPAPGMVTVTLKETAITVTLAEPAQLPAPWTGAGLEWQIALTDVPQEHEAFPPYPLLVSIGRNDAGSFVFLNLEELRTIHVIGDPARKAAFARHLAAELAVNPWASVNHVDILGLGSDLASFHLGRIQTHPAADTAFITALARNLADSDPHIAPDDFSAAIIATTERPRADLDTLAAVLHGFPGRTATALIELAGEPRPSDTVLNLDAHGRLTSDDPVMKGMNLTAAGLTADEARACALLLDLTLDTQTAPVPRSQDPTAASDLSGALVNHLTETRPDGGPAGDASLLPLDAQVYADAAATTIEDVATIAPIATPDAETTVRSKDPGLDADLARWETPTASATKLTLLGPVGARTTGDTKATAHRRPFYLEMLAYLALHPKGASATDLAEAFGIRPERVRVDMSQLRRWLGNDPQTGKPYLPNAEAAPDLGAPAVYRLHGVLSDLDLFRRLRARGQSRGADGIEDLITALRLVRGEPFTGLREGHWGWLLEGERWDHIMTSAIVDVGHTVCAHALATGEPDLALWAAHVAYATAPYDEVAQLDVIQAEKATGHDEQADAHLEARVFNRRDDDQPPIELPDRSKKVVGDKGWDTSARAHRTA